MLWSTKYTLISGCLSHNTRGVSRGNLACCLLCYPVTLFILMKYPLHIHIDTISMQLSILYFKGFQHSGSLVEYLIVSIPDLCNLTYFDSRPRGRGFEPHRCHYIVSLSKNINPNFVTQENWSLYN